MKFSNAFICANHEIADIGKIVPAPLFRKTFCLQQAPKQAQITICGLGFYELYVNGTNVTKAPLSSYIANPDQVCYYDCYDVANYLAKGNNTIGVLLGNGFRNAYGGFLWDFHKADCRGPVTLALTFESDEITFESDTSFKTHPSPILWNDIRFGYKYDARLEITDWALPSYDDSAWDNAVVCQKPPKGQPRICTAPPIAITEKLHPVKVTFHEEMPFGHVKPVENSRVIESTIRKNIYLFDFGKNMSGVTQLHVKNAKPGQTITIHHGEILLNGEFTVSNLMFMFHWDNIIDKYLTYSQCDVFVCKGGDETFVPKFKYDGFRYAFVEGLTADQVDDDTLVYLVENSDIKERADFNCSDETLNALFKMTRASSLSNMVHIPTDCPHREKNGWTGDASLSADHMLLNLDCADFLNEWLFTLSKAQTDKGDIPAIVPTGTWGYGDPYAGPVWDSVYVNVPYALYRFTGESRYVTDYADGIVAYFDYLKTKFNDKGLFEHGLGDWIEPMRRYHDDYSTAAPTETTSSIAVYRMLSRAAFLFEQVGLTQHYTKTKEFADQLRQTIREKLVDFDTMIVKGDCQSCQSYAIAAGIFNEDELDHAKKVLVHMIKHDRMLLCGIIGRRFIFDILTDMGECDLAHKLIVSKDVASFGSWVAKGYTTLCESFEPDGIDIDSRNHHFLGDISRWMIERLVGIRINPNCNDTKYVEISPNFPTDISHAQAHVDCKEGRIACSWKRDGNNVHVEVEIPNGYNGKLVVAPHYTTQPIDQTTLSAGTHTFDITLK